LLRRELPILLAVVVRKAEEDDEEAEEKRRCMLDEAMGGRKASAGTMLTRTTTQSEWKATRNERLAIQPAGGHAGSHSHKQQQQLGRTWLDDARVKRKKAGPRAVWGLGGWGKVSANVRERVVLPWWVVNV
jgi:hypothetical protein